MLKKNRDIGFMFAVTTVCVGLVGLLVLTISRGNIKSMSPREELKLSKSLYITAHHKALKECGLCPAAINDCSDCHEKGGKVK